MLKTIFVRIPSATAVLLAAVPVKSDISKTSETNNEPNMDHYIRRRTDLPLYTPLHDHNKKPLNVSQQHEERREAGLRGKIESVVRVVRQEVQAGYQVIDKKKESVLDIIDTAKSHSQSTLDYLNEPQNILPRTGAIAMGGLAGFIFAARGGFIKKILYTSFGAGGMASLCYPEQASTIAKDTLYEAKKGYAIAYNFVKGVKPGDEVHAETISKFPTSAEDVKYMLWDLYDEAKEALFPKKS